MRSTLSLARSFRLAVAWIAAAAVFGPLAYALGVTGWLIASGEPFWRTNPLAIPTTVLAAASFGIPGLILGIPLLAPLLACWAVIARRWPRLDSVAGVLAGTMSLAALGAILLLLVSERDPRPLAPHGLAALRDSLRVGGVVWLALVLPRVLIPPLRVGAFGTAHDCAAERVAVTDRR